MNKDTRAVYKTSENVISKNIEGICMLVPVVSGVGNLDSELFQLNETGSMVWERLDGKLRLDQIITDLCQTYDASPQIIETDVLKLVDVLLEKDFICKVL